MVSVTARLAARLRLSRCAAVAGREGWRAGGARRSWVATCEGSQGAIGSWLGRQAVNLNGAMAPGVPGQVGRPACRRAGTASGGGGGGSPRWWRMCCRHLESLLSPARANCSGGRGVGGRRAEKRRHTPLLTSSCAPPSPYLCSR